MTYPMTESRHERRQWPAWTPMAVAALLGMLIYATSIGGTYIYDDVTVALKDKRLPDPGLWKLFWTKDYYFDLDAQDGSIDNLYRPLVSMSFAVQVWLHGLGHPAPMHLLNVLLYGLSCAVVARLGRQIGEVGGRNGTLVSWVAGLLFAAHPVHAEVGASLVGRAELMAMLGLCGAVTVHLSGPLSKGRTWGVMGCVVLGILSKEQGLLAFAMLAAAEPVRRALHGRERDSQTAGQALILGVCLVTGFYIVLKEHILGLRFWWDRHFLDEGVQPLVRKDADPRGMRFVLFGNYLRLLVAPLNPSFDYTGPAIGWKVRPGDPHFYIGIVASILGMAALAVAAARRNWVWVFVLIGFALTYGMISNAVSLIGVIFAERLLFLPSVFFCLALGLAAATIGRRWIYGIVAALAIAGAVHTAIYVARWNDKVSFYEYSVRHNPKAIRIQQLLLAAYKDRGDWTRAAEITAMERATMPDYWSVWVDSSVVAEAQGKWDDAESYAATAFNLNPQVVGTLPSQVHWRRIELEKAATQPAAK